MNDEARRMTEQWEMLSRQWTDFMTKMGLAGLNAKPEPPSPEILREFRNNMLKTVAGYCNEYLRSPQFLDYMKRSMEGSLAYQKQLNETMTRMHHGLQGTAKDDVDTLLMSVRHIEQRILDRIDELDARLDKISSQVKAENGGGGVEKAATRQARTVAKDDAKPSTGKAAESGRSKGSKSKKG